MMLKHKIFTAVAVLTLALGIGATTALFSVVYGVLINPYPYANPEKIWTPGVKTVKENQRMRPFPMNTFEEMSKLAVFSDVMATQPGSVLLTGGFAPENIGGVRVSGNAFNFLGVKPILGRTIEPSDIKPNGEPDPVVVLSFKRWQRLFEGDPGAIGKSLKLNDDDYIIIGVMPPRFGWWTEDGVWLPLNHTSRDAQALFPIVRMAPSASTAAAEQQLHALFVEAAKDKTARLPVDDFKATLTNYMDITVASGEMRQSLQLLFGAVGFLLLIACANVANLQLAKATTRAREITIRMAVGAQRGHIWRQLLTESVMLSVLGGLIGLIFAYWITRLMVTLMPQNLVPNESRIEVNAGVLLFCLVVSLVTGILFGLAPAAQASRQNLADSLKEDARGATMTQGGRLRAMLVVVEVALAVVLLVSASLTIRSFVSLQNVQLGFRPENVMAVNLSLPQKQYATWELRNRFATDLLQRVRNTPGVVAANLGNGGMPFGGFDSSFSIGGQPEAQTQSIRTYLVAADYLKTLSIPLIQGRDFSEDEVNLSRRVALINEAAVKLWPAGENPIGRLIRLNELEKPSRADRLAGPDRSADLTVIGIIGNTRNDDLRAETQPAILIPYTLLAPPFRSLAVRASGDPMLLTSAIREHVQALDKEQPLGTPLTLETILGFRMAQPRFTMMLFTLFAVLGLAMALAGIYSVLSYLVSMRTREIGVRIALGAKPVDIVQMILRVGGKLVGAGILIGIILSVIAARLLGSQMNLFRVTSTDPVSFIVVALLIAAVAAAACLIPARQATKVDPLSALRFE
jgi:putative ABC transport system permease protein